MYSETYEYRDYHDIASRLNSLKLTYTCVSACQCCCFILTLYRLELVRVTALSGSDVDVDP